MESKTCTVDSYYYETLNSLTFVNVIIMMIPSSIIITGVELFDHVQLNGGFEIKRVDFFYSRILG